MDEAVFRLVVVVGAFKHPAVVVAAFKHPVVDAGAFKTRVVDAGAFRTLVGDAEASSRGAVELASTITTNRLRSRTGTK